jgi:hypothetical protein
LKQAFSRVIKVIKKSLNKANKRLKNKEESMLSKTHARQPTRGVTTHPCELAAHRYPEPTNLLPERVAYPLAQGGGVATC